MFDKSAITLAAAAMLLSAGARAEVAATADLGSTGAGAHLVAPLAPNLNGRFGINYFKHDFTQHSGSVDYQLKGKLQTADILLDWYLRDHGNFRITGGLVYNGSRFDANADPDSFGQFKLNGKAYSATDVGVLKGNVDFRKAAPYLGIGWGNALDQTKRWHVGADLGFYYQGEARVRLANTGCTNSAQLCSALAADVAAEQARLQQDASSYKFYPVARISLGYRF